MRGGARRLLGALVLTTGLLALRASAQRMDPKRPQSLAVGTPPGASPTERVDARRSGFSRTPLPGSTLRVAWRRTFAQAIDFPPLTLGGGEVALLLGRGDLVSVADDGSERTRTALGSAPAAAATALSNGTVVVVTVSGHAVGVRLGVVRFRTHLGGEPSLGGRVSPLSLEDGGVVVATANELTSLDAEGGIRARVSLPEALATPLVAAQGKIIAITASGVVYGWSPGREALRLGTFGAPIDGGATLADPHTLVAVVDGNRLAALDLARGVVVARAVAPAGVYLGPASLRGDTAYVLAQTPGHTFVVSIDASGQEVSRVIVATSPLALLLDGGVAATSPTAHTGTIVDRAGTVAFATPDGHVGVVTASGAVETLGESLCMRGTSPTKGLGAVVGIAPAAPAAGESGGFYVLCDGGGVAKVVSSDAH